MTTDVSIFGSWVALVTPMRADGSLDAQALEKLIQWHIEAGTSGIVVAGTTGESAALTDVEFERLVAISADLLDGNGSLMVGVGAACTRRCIELADIASGYPVDFLLAVTPYYLKTTQNGLLAHYKALADAADRPIVLYNVPSRTGTDLLPATTIALSADMRFAGIKEAVASAERIDALTQGCRQGFSVLSGDDDSCLMAMERGAHGVVSVTANILPDMMAQLCTFARDQQISASRPLQDWLSPIHQALMGEPNPIPVKSMLALRGLIEPALRLPLVGASQPVLDELNALLQRPLPRGAAEIHQLTRRILGAAVT